MKLTKTEQKILDQAKKSYYNRFSSVVEYKLVGGKCKGFGTRERQACISLVRKGLAKHIPIRDEYIIELI